MSRPNPITGRTAHTAQAVASDVTVNRYDHAAAAAGLMRHHPMTALLILDGDTSTPPIGLLTEAGLIQAAPDAAGSRAGSPAGR